MVHFQASMLQVRLSVQAVAYPADTVRRRMQLNGSVGQQQIIYTGYLDCVRSMAQTEGLRSFYRGFTVSCIKTAPSAAIQASHMVTT